MAARLALVAGFCAAALACQQKSREVLPGSRDASTPVAAPFSRGSAAAGHGGAPPDSRTHLVADAAAPESDARARDAGRLDAAATDVAASFVLKPPQRVGPAGAMAATGAGVVFVTANDELRIVDLARTEPISEALVIPVRPPAIARNAAYWVSRGRLVRRSFSAQAPLEVLATDALERRRVSALESANTAVVTYIARGPGNEPVARLWAEGRPSVLLTPAGASASSVTLAPNISGFTALALEGRSAMSPLHARRGRVTRSALDVDEDVVIWVGGSSQASTHVHAATADAQTFAFVPMERSATEFGLAQIRVPEPGQPSSEATWIDYLNGIDYAAVTSGTLCGKPVVVYAEPRERTPHAAQSLRLGRLLPNGIAESIVIANAGQFAAVSVAEGKLDGVIAYVADGGTFAVGVRCAKKRG